VNHAKHPNATHFFNSLLEKIRIIGAFVNEEDGEYILTRISRMGSAIADILSRV
jgi:hypothetical protein